VPASALRARRRPARHAATDLHHQASSADGHRLLVDRLDDYVRLRGHDRELHVAKVGRARGFFAMGQAYNRSLLAPLV
jgi:hypothetical protein